MSEDDIDFFNFAKLYVFVIFFIVWNFEIRIRSK
jgi:hypothetical protein